MRIGVFNTLKLFRKQSDGLHEVPCFVESSKGNDSVDASRVSVMLPRKYCTPALSGGDIYSREIVQTIFLLSEIACAKYYAGGSTWGNIMKVVSLYLNYHCHIEGYSIFCLLKWTIFCCMLSVHFRNKISLAHFLQLLLNVILEDFHLYNLGQTWTRKVCRGFLFKHQLFPKIIYLYIDPYILWQVGKL